MMSDEESFVILSGSPSLTSFQRDAENINLGPVQDTPSNCLSFLQRSQLSNGHSSIFTQDDKSISLESPNFSNTFHDGQDAVLSLRESLTPVSQTNGMNGDVEKAEEMLASDGPSKLNGTPVINSLNISFNQNNLASGLSSMATNFILGETNAEEIKNASIQTQFPNFSKTATPDEIANLQKLICEHFELKKTCEKADIISKEYYNFCQKNFQEFRKDLKMMKEENVQLKNELEQKQNQTNDDYQKKFEQLQAEMLQLKEENSKLHQDVKVHNEHLEMTTSLYQKDISDLKVENSEKNALIKNMRHYMDKLESQKSSMEHLTLEESCHEMEKLKIHIKEVEEQVKELEMENQQLKGKQTSYLADIHELGVKHAQGEELLKQARDDIGLLQAKDIEKEKLIEDMRSKIMALEKQCEVYFQDFNMERESRSQLAGENDKLLQNLKALQKRNLDLSTDLERYTVMLTQKVKDLDSISSTEGAVGGMQPVAKVPAYDELNRPVRNLPAPEEPDSYPCPICSVEFHNLSSLQNHVNYCIDQIH